MKRISIGAAMFCATSLAPFAPPTFAQPAMTPAACQPLTGANLEACCAAEDWREIILQGDLAFCPPLNAADTDSGRLGQTLADTDPVDEETTGSVPGNPGNAEDVGGAGEKIDKGMAETPGNPPTGVQGSSN